MIINLNKMCLRLPECNSVDFSAELTSFKFYKIHIKNIGFCICKRQNIVHIFLTGTESVAVVLISVPVDCQLG